MVLLINHGHKLKLMFKSVFIFAMGDMKSNKNLAVLYLGEPILDIIGL